MSELPSNTSEKRVPWFGVRKFARACLSELVTIQKDFQNKSEQLQRLMAMSTELVEEVKMLRWQRDEFTRQFAEYGYLDVSQLENKKHELEQGVLKQEAVLQDLKRQHEQQILEQASRIESDRQDALAFLEQVKAQRDKAQSALVNTDELSVLQEVGVYRYRHPLTDAVAYQSALAQIEDQISVMVKKDGGAILATTNWTVNNSAAEGRKMVREFSKLMLRAFNAEADNLVRSLKPYKIENALDRLAKVSETIARLGKTLSIKIAPAYQALRAHELTLTADFLQKQAEDKEIERAERDRLREERKAQQEIERERARLEKERQHYTNALNALIASGDEAAADRLRAQLSEVDKAIENVDYRAANIRAGYVYVISNIGSFGDKMVKVGMTRRLDPMDRIRELSDASVPFNFDVHALFFSNNAVTIEAEMHARLATSRVNSVNRRREFFRATPAEAKRHLSELAGELLEFNELPEALEYRQSLTVQSAH